MSFQKKFENATVNISCLVQKYVVAMGLRYFVAYQLVACSTRSFVILLFDHFVVLPFSSVTSCSFSINFNLHFKHKTNLFLLFNDVNVCQFVK